MEESTKDQSVFNPWPIGSTLVTTERVCKVVAHLEATWHGTDRPWYGVACEVTDGPPVRASSQSWGYQREKKVIAGALPEEDNWHVICLNGRTGGRLYWSASELETLYLGSGTWAVQARAGRVLLAVLVIEDGDASVGMDGSAWPYGYGPYDLAEIAEADFVDLLGYAGAVYALAMRNEGGAPPFLPGSGEEEAVKGEEWGDRPLPF